jgi:hypothetical protein
LVSCTAFAVWFGPGFARVGTGSIARQGDGGT